MEPTLIYCADGNKRFADIAIRYGFLYGAQLPNTVYHRPVFVDQDWRNPDRARYMAALAEYKPRFATVLDWEHEEQLPEVLSWAAEAAQYVSEDVIIIPKVIGGIAKLPRHIAGRKVRLGYSVPTKFAGTQVPVWEFAGWDVHLLGGSPQEQMRLTRYMHVVSVDGSYAKKLANTHSAYFANGAARYAKNRWFPQLKESGIAQSEDAPYIAFELSCINIRAAWQGAACSIRLAHAGDIQAIKRITNQYKNELGFVNSAALAESADRHELHIAEYNRLIVGFVRWHKRQDGVSTIYEIAVDRQHTGNGIGRALLCAVPEPTRLKCTVENRANAFYSAAGFTHDGTEPGRVRALNVWQRGIPR